MALGVIIVTLFAVIVRVWRLAAERGACAGRHTSPSTAPGPGPAVVFHFGSNRWTRAPYDGTGIPLWVANGVAVLSYDKRGVASEDDRDVTIVVLPVNHEWVVNGAMCQTTGQGIDASVLFDGLLPRLGLATALHREP